MYAPSDGYTLRFKTAELLRGQEEARPRHYFTLMRVVYKEEEQLALLGDLFDIVVKYAETHYPQPGDVQWSEGTLRGHIYRPLLQLLLTFKHPAFEVEQEWRLVCGESGHWSGAKYRAGKYGSTPYVEFYRAKTEPEPDANKSINKEKNEKRLKLPISHVMHGPIAGLGPANFIVAPEKPCRLRLATHCTASSSGAGTTSKSAGADCRSVDR